MREGDIIALFAALAEAEPGSFGLTDDTAVLTPPPNHHLVVTTDSVIESVHVLPDATPEQYAAKLLRRNLSDLAAMGAMPWRYLLNLTAPREVEEGWFRDFAVALQREQAQFGLVLVGGDTTRVGERLHCMVTMLGVIEGAPLTRHGARAGDDVWVSGTIGDAALGLAMLQADRAAHGLWVDRYHMPQPRLALGKALCGIASAALDCSDGLLKDLARLCDASGVGVELQRDATPLSPDTRALFDNAPNDEAREALWQTVLTGGDDYELIFTALPEASGDLTGLAKFLKLPLTRIGTLTEARDLYYRDHAGLHRFGADTGWEY